ncbi:polyprenyl synthetase family protein [Paenibacillus wynnii]|uniref:Polyprenyl synthetase n=1 Tax=Paenibacillus wynnii TaxID=268407 RepID=A0A098ME40_9BACL|nr:polyprenyl synthetase family protein [Paenibacillus wynnii]KGE19802.1 hypothetical protein PWYN_10970 [Paenibacillus wynnii]
MNTETIIEEIFTEINERTLFDKYNNGSEAGILQVIDLRHMLKQFSWGLLYLYIYSFRNKPIVKEDITLAANIEMLCLSSKILDDLLDEDKPAIAESIGNNNVIFLFADLLIESLSRLHTHSSNERGYVHLQSAMLGEWMDVNKTVIDGITEQQYLNQILPKTVAILKLVAAFADPEEQVFWEKFLTYAGTAMQLSNDLHAVFNDTKSDLPKLKPTLPLLKMLEISDENTKAEMKMTLVSYAAGGISIAALREAIIASGSLEYCILTRELCKDKCSQMLYERFPENVNLNAGLLMYLGLVTV